MVGGCKQGVIICDSPDQDGKFKVRLDEEVEELVPASDIESQSYKNAERSQPGGNFVTFKVQLKAIESVEQFQDEIVSIERYQC